MSFCLKQYYFLFVKIFMKKWMGLDITLLFAIVSSSSYFIQKKYQISFMKNDMSINQFWKNKHEKSNDFNLYKSQNNNTLFLW